MKEIILVQKFKNLKIKMIKNKQLQKCKNKNKKDLSDYLIIFKEAYKIIKINKRIIK